ncbi:MAG: hypothetical protein WCP26_11875 [Actinomycetes bacterium]
MNAPNTDQLTPSPRVDEAAWFTNGLAGFGGRVENVIPRGFAAYARILHPAKSTSADHPVSWAEVAAFTGTELHPLAQFHAIARWLPGDRVGWRPDANADAPSWAGRKPELGTLDAATLTAVYDLLADFTATPSVWLSVWEGWGNLPVAWAHLPKVHQAGRSYYLFERPLAAIVDFSLQLRRTGLSNPSMSQSLAAYALESGSNRDAAVPATKSVGWIQSPSQWWPGGHSWCVASEIDFDSTLVGGTAELINAITNHALLEAFPVVPSDDLTIHGDRINTGT